MAMDDEQALTSRLNIPVSKKLASAVESYRFTQRISSKAAAIRRLIEKGLEAERKGKK